MALNLKTDTLDDFLLLEMSRRNTDLVADLVFQKPELFEELFLVFARNEEPISRRAAWVLDTVSEQYPELLAPHLDEITDLLPKFSHDGLKRHSLRMLARLPLPDDDRLGELITICFNWLLSPVEAVSAKIYSMDLLYRVSQIEPDLKQELADSIEWRINEGTPGYQHRGRKMLKQLNAEINNRTKP